MKNRVIATYMLREALIKCEEYGLNEVLLGCYRDNIGSLMIIINNGGILDRKDYIDGKVFTYYRIKIK